MTIAICYKCGEMKKGAFNACGKCGATPDNEKDLALSMAMTDHFFNEATLKQMSGDLKAGEKIQLSDETKKSAEERIRALGVANLLKKKPE